MTPIIVNPEAGNVDGALLQQLVEREGVVVRETGTADATREAVRDCVRRGAGRIVAAGGDGTVHVVANALLASGAAAEVDLGVLPCGTGNDLARTLGLPLDEDALDDALDRALTGTASPMDVIRLVSGEAALYAVNAAAGGFAGEVNAVMSDAKKDRWGPLAFVLGAAEALPHLEGHATGVQIDDQPVEETDAVNVIVANGRTIAGGKEVAPPADVRDGRLDVVVVHQAALPDLAAAGARLLAGDWLEHPLVTHRTGRRVVVDSSPPMRFNADGELWAEGRVEAEVVPGALRVVG